MGTALNRKIESIQEQFVDEEDDEEEEEGELGAKRTLSHRVHRLEKSVREGNRNLRPFIETLPKPSRVSGHANVETAVGRQTPHSVEAPVTPLNSWPIKKVPSNETELQPLLSERTYASC